MPPATLTSVAREHMADAIVTMQAACHADGLAYTEEMTALVLAWLYTRRAQGKGGEILIDAPSPDAEQESPGHLLLRCSTGLPLDLLTIDDLPPPPRQAEPTPVRVRRKRVPDGTYTAYETSLQAVLDGRMPELRITLAKINANSFRVRCSLIGRTSRTHKLSTTIVGDMLRVTRTER